MHVTINRRDRDAIYDGLMTDLSAIGDVFIDLHNDEPASAKPLYRRFEVELRLLDDLGWEKEPEAERFELTMPARALRPVIERIYWSAVGSLTDHPEELVDEAVHALMAATSACPELLARLAEDDLLDPEVRRVPTLRTRRRRRSEGCAARAEPLDARRIVSGDRRRRGGFCR